MKILKAEIFAGWHPKDELVAFVQKNGIQREDILTITQVRASFTLFYYAE